MVEIRRSVLQCAAVCCSALAHRHYYYLSSSCVLQCGRSVVAVCCSVLQCVAVCCSVVQCGAVQLLQHCIAVCWSVLQCGCSVVAVWLCGCNVVVVWLHWGCREVVVWLQCGCSVVAVWRSVFAHRHYVHLAGVLQCVAVCCKSVLTGILSSRSVRVCWSLQHLFTFWLFSLEPSLLQFVSTVRHRDFIPLLLNHGTLIFEPMCASLPLPPLPLLFWWK